MKPKRTFYGLELWEGGVIPALKEGDWNRKALWYEHNGQYKLIFKDEEGRHTHRFNALGPAGVLWSAFKKGEVDAKGEETGYRQ